MRLGLTAMMGLLALWLTGCESGPSEVAIAVYMRTDFVPIREFTGVDVIPTDDTSKVDDAVALASLDYVNTSQRVAFIEGLTPVESRTFELILATSTGQVRTPFSVPHLLDQAVTVFLTRDCEFFNCAGDQERCIAGNCVSDRCLNNSEADACIDKSNQAVNECENDGGCAPHSCATARCIQNVCYYDAPASTSCGANEACDPVVGCVPAGHGCAGDSNCDRGGECLVGVCIAGTCVYRGAPDGTSCSTGVCTTGVCS